MSKVTLKKFLEEENRLWKSGFRFIAGIDESGRGALAGPVVAACCLITNFSAFLRHCLTQELIEAIYVKNFSRTSKNFIKFRDSKSLSPKCRQEIFHLILQHPHLKICTSAVGANLIDRLNIRRATLLAMRQAVLRLPIQPNVLLIDGIECPFMKKHQYTYIKGDSRIFLIAVASIIAKVKRDLLMTRLGQEKFPHWAFEIHKGYGTPQHRHLIKKHGLSPIHRRTFTF